MTLAEIFHDLFFDYTLRTVALGSATLGIVSGALGSYAVLRKQSLLGDAISHAALPGIVIAFLITRSKLPIILMAGAAAAGWIGTLLIISIVKNTRIKHDTALGMILSVFFGLGLMLLTFVQKIPDASQSGLDHFLFGQASALLERDVLTMACLGLISFLFVALFWKEFKLLCFDPDYAASLGYPIGRLDVLLTTILVIAIVVGLQAVGVVLMSTMVVAPGAAARQWTDRMGRMIILAALFGGLAGVIGAVISATTVRMPTGPTIVLCISGIVVISMFLAPKRGLLWNHIREHINRRKIQLEAVLSDLYALALQHENPEHPHSTSVLMTMAAGHGGVVGSLSEMQKRGWVQQVSLDQWALTQNGWEEAERLNELRTSGHDSSTS